MIELPDLARHTETVPMSPEVERAYRQTTRQLAGVMKGLVALFRDSTVVAESKTFVGKFQKVHISRVLSGLPSLDDLDSWVELSVYGEIKRYGLPDAVAQAERATLKGLELGARVQLTTRGNTVLKLRVLREPARGGSIEVIGFFEKIESAGGRRILFLRGGRVLRIPDMVCEKSQRVWPFLKKGDKITYQAKGDILLMIRAGR